MAIPWGVIIKIAAKVFGYLLKQMTPELEKVLENTLKDLYVKAVATSNPFDDHIMAMLLEVLDIEKPVVPEET